MFLLGGGHPNEAIIIKLDGGFNPFEKILVKMGSFPLIGVKIKNHWNHHPAY